MKTPWRDYPPLVGRFHPKFPDDIQILVHDGGYRFTKSQPEVIWARVIGLEDNVLRGEILNNPHQLKNIRQGDEILFIVPKGGDYPLLVSEKYLAEREDWVIRPCDKCGFDELFDAPSDFIDLVFHNLEEGSTLEVFSYFCNLCGGVQIVNLPGIEATFK
jgi:hypothetical protein